MSHAFFRTSTLLTLALAAGCAMPTGTKSPTSPVADENNVSNGAIKNGAVPAVGIVASNAGSLSGIVRGPAAGLISNNAAGLISNNSGGLISNNSGGLISNNSGGLISNNSGGYRTLAQSAPTVPLPNVEVAVYNAQGAQVSFETCTTDGDGHYTFTRLRESPPILFVVTSFKLEGRDVSMMAATMAPRKEDLTVTLDPASTMVAKKLREMLAFNKVAAASVTQTAIDQLTAKVGAAMSDRAAAAALIFESNKAALTFDNMVGESNALRDAIQTIITAQKTGNLLDKTPVANSPTVFKPEPRPSSATGGSNTPSSTAPSAGTSTAPGASPTPTPSPTPAPKGVVATLGTYPGGSLAFGAGALSAAGGSALKTASVSGLTSALTFSVDGSAAAKAVAFDGTSRYQLTDTTIVKPNNQAVSLTGLASADDLVVSGNTAYVVSRQNHGVYSVDLTSGAVALLAGGASGYADGSGSAAKFNQPTSIALANGKLYVADSANRVIRQVTTAGAVTTLAGSPSTLGNLDGDGGAARFSSPYDLAVDGAGNLYLADFGNNNIREITAAGKVSTVAGDAVLRTQDGTGLDASFKQPQAIAFGRVGSQDVLFVGEVNGSLRAVTGW